MKKGWKVERLGDVCDFMNGLWKGKKPPFINVGVIRNTNFTKDCLLDDTDIAYLDVEKSLFAKRNLQYGDIILEKSGGGPKQPVGRVVVFDKTDGKFSFSNFTSVLRIKDKNQLDFRFLHKYLYTAYVSGVTEKMQSHSTGIRNLKFDEYKQIPVPIPPLPEQQRIVALLDETFAALTKVRVNAECNQVNAREMFESMQREIFGNGKNKKTKTKMLGDIASFRNGINFTKNSKGEKLKIVGVKDFQKNFWVPFDNLDSVQINGKLNESDYLRKGDILAVRSNGNQQLIGRTILADDVKEKTTHSGFTIRIRFEPENIFPEYLCHYLKSDKARKQMISGGAGISIKSLNQQTLSNLNIPLPPLAEQRAIVQRLDALAQETRKLEEVYRFKVDDVEELRRSVLGKAFAGEL